MLDWVTNFVRGDFGESFQYERPVADLLGQRIMFTVDSGRRHLTLTWMIAIPVGVYSATHQYSLGDQIITTISFIGLGTPSFLLALLVLFVAVVVLGQDVGGPLFPRIPGRPVESGQGDGPAQAPVGAGPHRRVTGTAGLIRIMRGNLLDTLGQPFVEAARARGLRSRTVTWKHAVRIAINPLIVILGSEALPAIIAGNALMAIVLNLPTMGPLWLEALQEQDMYMAVTGIVFFSLFFGRESAGGPGAGLADPRIRLRLPIATEEEVR